MSPFSIIDTKVVVAGLLTAHADSPVARILDGMLGASFPFVVPEALLAEYLAVLTRPKLCQLHGLSVSEIDSIPTDMARHAIVLNPANTGSVSFSPDAGDQFLWDLLATARVQKDVGDPNAGFLVLDRDFNSSVDKGTELLSNPLLADAAKGVQSLEKLGIKAINYGQTDDEIDSASGNNDEGYSQISSKVLKSAQDGARYTEQGAGIKIETPDGEPLIVITQVQSEAAVMGLWHDRCRAKNASNSSANESVWGQAA